MVSLLGLDDLPYHTVLQGCDIDLTFVEVMYFCCQMIRWNGYSYFGKVNLSFTLSCGGVLELFVKA